MRIGVVGDIHGNYNGLRRSVRLMNHPDLILFTGDGFREISRLRDEIEIPVEGVAGNCDGYTDYPNEIILKLDKFKALLTHGYLYGVKNGLTRIGLAGRTKGVNLVIFGHTHEPLNDDWYEVRLFNPGSLSVERSFKGPSFGLIEVGEAGIHGMINYI